METGRCPATAAVPNPRTCDRCGVRLRQGWVFTFKSLRPRGPAVVLCRPTDSVRCVWCALKHPALLRRSLIASVVVGTVLTLLNQGDTLLSGHWSNALYWKIPLTYCVPFIVATYGALSNNRQ